MDVQKVQEDLFGNLNDKNMAKKIMFNDKYGLTQAVLEGRKTQTRRVIKVQPPYKNFDMAFPVFVEEDWHTNPLYGAFCWVNKDNPEEHTDWIRPAFKEGEVVAVAQGYRDCGGINEEGVPMWEIISQRVGGANAGWDNKMFVRADLMPHQILITDVRVKKLRDISDDDCLKEGVRKVVNENGIYIQYYVGQGNNACSFENPREAFAHLFDKVGKGLWDSNPYVWVYDFELVK